MQGRGWLKLLWGYADPIYFFIAMLPSRGAGIFHKLNAQAYTRWCQCLLKHLVSCSKWASKRAVLIRCSCAVYFNFP